MTLLLKYAALDKIFKQQQLMKKFFTNAVFRAWGGNKRGRVHTYVSVVVAMVTLVVVPVLPLMESELGIM